LDSFTSISIGACAWSFADWRGVLYPEHLPENQRLAHYARYLRAVEIDSTFYGPPSRKTAQHWLEATPPNFRFTCKMPREITHARKLHGCRGDLAQFLRSLEPLASKLGCILIQLPPYFHHPKDEPALREFIRELPAGFHFAVEFRDPAWHAPRVVHLLQDHGVCWAWNDLTPVDHRNEGAFAFLPRTADFLYLRLLGDLTTKYDEGKRRFTYRSLLWPRNASLESWALKITQERQNVSEVFAMASNHFEGFAPLTCQRLAARLQIEITLPKMETDEAAPGGEQLELLPPADRPTERYPTD
jgi:uncharacterized protein YecE (DUF72 family)